jgi:hypothetical protein
MGRLTAAPGTRNRDVTSVSQSLYSCAIAAGCEARVEIPPPCALSSNARSSAVRLPRFSMRECASASKARPAASGSSATPLSISKAFSRPSEPSSKSRTSTASRFSTDRSVTPAPSSFVWKVLVTRSRLSVRPSASRRTPRRKSVLTGLLAVESTSNTPKSSGWSTSPSTSLFTAFQKSSPTDSPRLVCISTTAPS